MNEMQMNAQELLYLSSQLGATEFFGIADPFMGMSPEEIRGAIAKAQISLDEKGLVQMNFDGSFQITEAAADIARVCALCDAYLSAEFVIGGRASRQILYFLGREMVLLLPGGDSLLLRRCGLDGAIESVRAVMAKSEIHGATEPGLPETIPFDVLAASQKALCAGERGKAEELLVPHCGNERLRRILLEGFGQTSDFCNLMLTNFKANSVTGIMCVNAPSGLAGITKSETDEFCWTVSTLSPEELEKRIQAQIQACLEICGKEDA